MTCASRTRRRQEHPGWQAAGSSFALAIALAACSPGSDTSFSSTSHANGTSGTSIDTSTPEACDRIAKILKVRERSLGSGGQVVLRLEDARGEPLPAATYAHCLELVQTSTGVQVKSSIATSTPDAVRTLIVIAPGTQEVAGETLKAAEALIDARAADEQVALYSAEPVPVQLSTFHTDQKLLKALAERAPTVDLVDPNGLAEPSRDLANVGQGQNWLRRLILLAPSHDLLAPAKLQFGDTDTVLVVGRDTTAADDTRIVDISGAAGAGGSPAATQQLTTAVTDAVSERLSKQRAAGFVHLGVCLADASSSGAAGAAGAPATLELPLVLTARVAARVGSPQSSVFFDIPLPEDAGLVCDPTSIASEWPAPTKRVQFRMTAAQRGIYDAFVDGDDKSDFELSVRPMPASGFTPAIAHLRGVSSLGCERKSYTVDLERPEPRFTFPGLGTDEIQLISMCLEDEPIHHNTAHALMHRLDLSIIASRVVELQLDGTSLGAYLLLEKHKELFLNNYTRVRSVLRRDMSTSGGEDEAEVKFTLQGTPDGQSDYLGLLSQIQPMSGPALERALRARLHLDQYLRWVALMSLLHSGDYTDEVLLIGTETRTANGQATSLFHINGWDADDIFQDCHFEGRYAVEDTFDLSYCAESELDHKLLSDPHTYGLYVAALAEVIERIPTAAFREAVDTASADLLAVLAAERARLAMVELLEAHPGASNLATLRTVLEQRADELEGLYDARRTLMLSRIEAYRASASAP